MNSEELEIFLHKGEDQQTEYKQSGVKIPVSSQVHSYKGVIYDREYDSDIAITDDTRISEIYFRKRNTFSESEILPHFRFEDFDENLFQKFAEIEEIDPFLFQKGSSWIEKRGKLANCRINKINDIGFLGFHKGSSTTEKGGKYLRE